MLKKNFLIVLTVFLLVFQMIAVSADTDMMNAFGIPVDESGSDAMTRMEFMQIISSVLPMDTGVNDAEIPFTDLENYQENTQALTAVTKLYACGIIRGNSKNELLPDQKIGETEAVTMLVRLLGYEQAATSQPYPDGYLNTAGRIGLYQNVTETQQKERLYALFCNALEIAVMEQTHWGADINYEIVQEKTILNSLMKIETYTGKITAIGECALSASYSAPEGQARIGDFLFDITDELALDLKANLGQSATVYYRENEENQRNTLIYFKAKTMLQTKEIPLESITSFVGNTLRYLETNETEKTIFIQGAPYIVYNNRPVSFLPSLGQTGTLKLLGNAGNYEVIIIEDYDTAMVKSVSLYENTIHLEQNTRRLISLDDIQEVRIYDEACKPISLEDISESDVLSILESSDGSCFVIYKSSRSVYGKVTQVSLGNYRESVFTISGIEYGLTEEFFASLSGEAEYLNMIADFHLDRFGKVANVSKSNHNGLKIGYLVASKNAASSFENPEFRIFTQASEMKDFEVNAEKFTANGISQNFGTYIASLQLPCLVSYETNSKGLITGINEASTTRTDGLYRFNQTTSGTYRSAVHSFGNSVICSPEATVFVVPEESAADALDESYYSIESLGSFSNSYNYSDLKFYATSENALTANIVVYTKSTGGLFDHTSVPVMVDKVVTAVNSQGEVVDKIYVYNDGVLTSYFGKAGVDLNLTNRTVNGAQISVTNVEQGDIVRLGFTAQNEIGGVQLVYDCSATNGYYHSANPYSLSTSYKICFGTVTKTDGDIIEVYFDHNSSYEYYNISNTKVVSYYNENGKRGIRTGTEDTFIIKDQQQFATDVSKVFIFSSSGVPKCIYLY